DGSGTGADGPSSEASLCTSPRVKCGDACSDVSTDAQNCGSCGYACAQPTPHCASGACTCAGQTCGSACVDTASDPKNCGRCEHDCLGGACQSGTCQPIAVASGQGAPGTLRIDANNLYWLNGGHIGQVVKMPLHGGVPTILADAQDFPHSLAIDNSA